MVVLMVMLKTPVRAQRRVSREELDTFKDPGSFFIEEEDGELMFRFFCPCGCGNFSTLIIGRGFMPDGNPTWEWDGNEMEPTLSPSLNNEGHWHGWLQGGWWRNA